MPVKTAVTQQRPIPTFDGSEQKANLGRRWNVDTDAQPCLLAPLALPFPALGPPLGHFPNRISDDKPAFLCVGQYSAQADGHALYHCRRAPFLAQLILKAANAWHGQFGQQRLAYERNDVKVEVLAVLVDRRTLEAAGLARLDPLFARLLDRNGGAVGDVRAFANLDCSDRFECVGVLFALERFQPACAVAVRVVDNPCLFLDALCGRPVAFSNRHLCFPPSWQHFVSASPPPGSDQRNISSVTGGRSVARSRRP